MLILLRKIRDFWFDARPGYRQVLLTKYKRFGLILAKIERESRAWKSQE
jgi:hypothetical protein